jgi:hypothetical protein
LALVFIIFSVKIKEMVQKKEQLNSLSESYLKFLIERNDQELKNFLSMDFAVRLKVTQQLKLIKTLPTALNYGINPEAHLWDEYVTSTLDDIVMISPFQFDVSFRNINNPLISETMTVTIHALLLENGEWKIASLLSDDDHNLLINYAAKTSTYDKRENTLADTRQIQPKK